MRRRRIIVICIFLITVFILFFFLYINFNASIVDETTALSLNTIPTCKIIRLFFFVLPTLINNVPGLRIKSLK